MLFFLACCLSARILFKLEFSGYAIYYNGPILLSFLLISTWFLDASSTATTSGNRGSAILPYLATLVLPLYKPPFNQVAFTSDRGVIYTAPQKALAYHSVLEFIQQQQTASFLSVPEDTSLYFFAGIRCPIRVYQFAPGVLAPGKMTSGVIDDIEKKKVRYLIWSNRTFEAYGGLKFGVDFDHALSQYLSAVYRPIRTIGDETNGEWKAVIWERIENQ
jgi:hypothetical protein